MGTVAASILAADFAKASKAPAMQAAYGSDFRIFEVWCAARGISSLPATAESLCGFLADEAAAGEAMITEIKAAAKDGDSLGGIVEVLGFGVPVGLGSHVHWDRKLDALLAQAIMSIQAVKGVEIGDGFDVAGRRGSVAHDPISWDADAKAYRRGSTLAGGTEGGISTGDLLVVRAAMKPLATLNKPTLETVDTETKDFSISIGTPPSA